MIVMLHTNAAYPMDMDRVVIQFCVICLMVVGSTNCVLKHCNGYLNKYWNAIMSFVYS